MNNVIQENNKNNQKINTNENEILENNKNYETISKIKNDIKCLEQKHFKTIIEKNNCINKLKNKINY